MLEQLLSFSPEKEKLYRLYIWIRYTNAILSYGNTKVISLDRDKNALQFANTTKKI